MNRRSFLLGSASVLCSLPVAAKAQLVAFQTRLTCVVVTDVSAETSIQHLITLFDVFFDKAVPFTCVVDPFTAEGTAIEPGHDLSLLLSGYGLQGSDMEIATFLPDLPNQSEYFQSRSARDANEILRNMLKKQRNPRNQQTLLRTVAYPHVASPEEPTGIRSAGVTTALALPDQDAPVTSEHWPNGVVRVFGGSMVDLARYTTGGLSEPEDATQSVLYLSAKRMADLTQDELAARASVFADDLLRSELAGRNSVQRVSDIVFRDDYGFKRLLAVHLVRPPADDVVAMDLIDAFRSELSAHGIHASLGDLAGHTPPRAQETYWLPADKPQAPAGDATRQPDLPTVLYDAVSGPKSRPDVPEQTVLPGHALSFLDLNDGTPGLDKDAVLWLPCLDVATADTAVKLVDYLDHTNDVVLSIRADALTLPYARNALKSQLLALARSGINRIVPVSEFGQEIVPHGAELDRQRRTVAMRPRTQNRPTRLTGSERNTLLEDAKIAWTYFEQNTIEATGLCPATVNFSPRDGRKHPTVTMWDVGSHINALVAASQLGLISQKGFDRNISQILTQVRGRSSQGRLLPQGWLRVDRQKWGNRNFDGSDAGRLLASFENLRRFAKLGDRLGELVDTWDLDQIVVDGEVNSVTDGKLHSVFRSHSAHYSARAFRLWGTDVRSPYEVTEGLSPHDGQMALLEAASWIGPLGAEPLLLEAMEIGMSEESAYLAEVLFAAQFEEFEESGRFMAVSEGPIDVAPWFTYQGLQLDATKRTWALDTVGHDDKYMQPAFWRENLVISSKAAFLWAAYKPHDYSSQLLQHVRANARTKRGFASSIFSRTGRVTENYTDLNTNAVILQSIARMLVEA